ncbi:DnaD domain protein [Radiobacillus sp. PE A8.2]|uniref:DnaD domain protein n=1 Tax=Radiobacillus sp. PE A8.2 TaxID=3380349 RepID=UPI0038905C40
MFSNLLQEHLKYATTAAVTYYEQHFGKIHPYMRSELEKWLSEAGDDLVMEAMKRAVDYHKLSWSYVKKILIRSIIFPLNSIYITFLNLYEPSLYISKI